MDASGHAVKFNLSAVMFTTVVGVSVVVCVGVSVVVVSIGASVVIVEDVEGVGEGEESLPPLSANITIMMTIPIITLRFEHYVSVHDCLNKHVKE